MLVSDFHYDLPEERIAQQPLPDRSASRLLHFDRSNGSLQDLHFPDLVNLLRPDDLVVFNNSRVFPARLYGRRQRQLPVASRQVPVTRGSTGNWQPATGNCSIEVLLTRQLSPDLTHPNEWECLVRPGRKIGVGEQLYFGESDELQAEVVARGSFGERRIRFREVDDFFGMIEKLGHVPLPPYISREDSPHDRERYQTVYARDRGSIAAPTAGLHFTPEILARIKERGIQTAEITLHVGLGTFQPIRTERMEEHQLHSERFTISPEASARINDALQNSRRVIAVGTTAVRTLEFAAQQANGAIAAGQGEVNLFIYPGFEFRVVRGMLTNFHLPQSSLLMLVAAFGGKENVLRAYHHAVSQSYRFYSYGDCMFLE